ncbi:hypothetical protein C2R22_05670 [Salinigranum rubrum]|uniref:DUF429 domain-containing protein n=1 Tax=Salinigranum rubrum TaxID=755307 RepID=A0A2I8VH13_9EURY|nr:DUF429 domain-containing protein [Salinigranum rubrum]AUV81211.1 hypothetical protein C2R22_05670 [Salinigranum rubrum]
MSLTRTHMFGVDFSGSQTPGRSIWITEARYNTGGFKIESCRSAIDRFNLSSNPSRDTVYNELRDLVRSHPSAVFGFDFPFSLPEPVIGDNTWPEYLDTLQNYFDNHSAERFRKNRVGRAESATGARYLRRETDWKYGGQCPYSPQIQYQTLYGQRDLLAPLITKGGARALPLQTRVNKSPWLIEVYPAATLSLLGFYRQGYKNQPKSKERRESNVDGLRNRGVKINNSIRDICRKSDDAHDSLFAAYAVLNALQDDFPKDNNGAAIEGQIFV